MKNRITELKKRIASKIDEYSARLIEISEYIHHNPELGFKEFKSSQRLIEELQKSDFTVEKNVAGLATAFSAVAKGKGGGPAIAFLAEYDALAGMGHACGHNIIGTASLGAGIGVQSIIKDICGSVHVIGTPAEEGGGGKIILLEKGAFKGIDISLMMHPLHETYAFRSSLAVKDIEFVFHGKPAHAAACPEEGINALDAVVQTYNSINALRLQLPVDVRIHGIITDGGMAANIISARAAVKYAVRTKNQNYLEELLDRVTACAKGAALATGATLEINRIGPGYDALQNNVPIQTTIKENFKLLGIDETPPSTEPTGMGSLDMGNISQAMPAAHPFLAICDGFGPHTDQFREAAISKRGHETMIKASKLLAYTAVDLFVDEALYNKAKQDYEN